MATRLVLRSLLLASSMAFVAACDDSGSDSAGASLCGDLDKARAAMASDPTTLRGAQTSEPGAVVSAFSANVSLPGAAKCDILDSDSSSGTYACDYPSSSVDALRDQVNACMSDKLTWDSPGKQWVGGLDGNITVTVQALPPSGAFVALVKY